MCLDPLTAVSLAASAAGAAINGSEAAANNKRMVEARNAATNAELTRQHGFQGQSGDIFSQALAKFGPQAAPALATNQDAATDKFMFNAPTAAQVGSIGTAGGSAAGAANEGRTIADAFTSNAKSAENLGNLTGYDTTNFNHGIDLAGSGRGLGTISDLSGNSARVGALEADVNANNAYRQPSGLGDLLGFAGTMGGYYGGRGMTMPTKAALPAFRMAPGPGHPF